MANAIPVNSKVLPEGQGPAVPENLVPVNGNPAILAPKENVMGFSKGVQMIFAEAEMAARAPKAVIELPNGTIRQDW